MSEGSGIVIGVDARAAVEVPAGRGRLVRELLRELSRRDLGRDRLVLYARERWPEVEDSEQVKWRLVSASDPWWHMQTARRANRECDVFLSSNSYLTVSLLRIPSVPIVYDLVTFEPEMRPNKRSMIIERITLGRALRRARAVIAISHATASALAERFPAAAAKTVVAQLGVAPSLTQPLSGDEIRTLPAPGFVLAVGTLEPRKNLPRLVAAFAQLPSEMQSRHPLVVVGKSGWETGETLRALRSLGERCVNLGYVSDASLAELYRRCATFCYPSLGEGFGLPVLEAMAAGAAVITSNISSLPEVGGDAVEYVDPQDPASIATGLRKVLDDGTLRSELAERGRLRAARFTWEGFADTVLQTLRQAGAATAPAKLG